MILLYSHILTFYIPLFPIMELKEVCIAGSQADSCAATDQTIPA